MTDRSTELNELAARLRTREVVEDAFPARENLLADHDLRGASEVYGESDNEQSLGGPVGDTTRHHLVDMQTRGDHQSYVIN